MKIDFDMLQKIVDAGATGAVILTMWREHEARKDVRRAADRERKGAENGGKTRKRAERKRKTAEASGDAATLQDTPRARLFRDGVGILLTLNIPESRARPLIAQWLKVTNDDDKLVMAAIVGAQNTQAADAPGWILATLKGKMNERSGNPRTNQATGSPPTRSDAVIAGMAGALDRRRQARGATEAGHEGVREGRGAGPAGHDDAEPGAAGGDAGACRQLALLPAPDAG